MKLFVVAVMATAGLGFVGGPAFAQTQPSDGIVVPNMQECQELHDRVLGDIAPHDAAAREAALEALDEATGQEMKVCLAMMQGPNDAATSQAAEAGDKPSDDEANDAAAHPK